MRGSGRLVTDVADLIALPGSTKLVRVSAPLEGLGVDLARIPAGAELGLDLRLDSIVEGIHVSGRVGGPVLVSCRRCVAELERDLDVEVEEIFEYAPEDEDAYRVAGEAVDLEPMVRDAVMLALPMNPLCKEDCRGLCPICGEDLNARECGHDRSVPEVRWEPLKQLRQRMEE